MNTGHWIEVKILHFAKQCHTGTTIAICFTDHFVEHFGRDWSLFSKIGSNAAINKVTAS